MTSGNKKFIFLVQGEGRGHMTQAISLYQKLVNNGHEVSHIFIGKSRRRQIPDFFLRAFSISVEPINSPNFVTDSRNRSILLFRSIICNALYLTRYYKSLKRIDQVVRKVKPVHRTVLVYRFIQIGLVAGP